MSERDLGLPPMDVAEALSDIDPSDDFDGYVSEVPAGALAAYDEPAEATRDLVHAVAERLAAEAA